MILPNFKLAGVQANINNEAGTLMNTHHALTRLFRDLEMSDEDITLVTWR